MERIVFRVALLGLILTSVFGITGCGGGGGGGDSGPVTSTETFQLKTAYINSLTTASSKPFSISGTSSGISVSGSGTVTESSLTSAVFEGVSCNQQVMTVTGNVSGSGTTVPFGGTQTTYYDSNYNYLGSSSDDYTVVIGTMSLPQTAKVNDTGVVFTETIYPSSAKAYSTGTNTFSYTLEPDTATTALLKLILTEKNTSGTVVSTSIKVSRITPAGASTDLYETTVEDSISLKITY